jgi:hypothetical protein
VRTSTYLGYDTVSDGDKYRTCPECGVRLTQEEEARGRCVNCTPWTTAPTPEPKKALHFSEGKPGVDQIPPELLLEWGEVFSYGEKKYARDNWKLGLEWHQFLGSALRHIYRWQLGEDRDPESGLPHLAHALWNIGCLRYYQLRGLGTDTRPVVDAQPKQGTPDDFFNKLEDDPFAYSDEEVEAAIGATKCPLDGSGIRHEHITTDALLRVIKREDVGA